MRRRCTYQLSFVLLVIAAAVRGAEPPAKDSFVAAPSTVADGQSGVVLLQDGGVLTGKISQAAEWYVVGRSGGQMQVAASRVMFVGRSLHEAYDFRRQRLASNSVETHLALAEWCLRYDLLAEAGDELNAARNLGPDHPNLAVLDRRLAAANERPPKTAPIATQKVSSATAAGPSTPSAVTPDLPSGVLEMFTRKVQPVLVNNCTVSKCHEPGGQQSFQLNRAVLRGEANRHTTMQNLAAALALVDREHPETSALLTVPRQTHGGMSGPIFGARQELAFKHLSDWVALVAPANTQEPPVENATEAAVAATPPAETRAAKARTAAIARSNARSRAAVVQTATQDTRNQAGHADPIVDPAVEPAAATDEPQLKTLRSPHRLKYGMNSAKWQPRDPFDPEIFNRQMHPATAPPAATLRSTPATSTADPN
jgi:hypothetical protein